MRREVKRLSRSRTALFAVAIAALGPTVLSTPWADSHLGAHFVSQLLIVAVGLPCLIVLTRNAPLAALEPDASKRSPPPSRGRRASGRQRPRALPARKVGPPVAQPDRVRLAARLAVGFGILTCENEAQALERASPATDQGGRDQGGRAVRACLALVELKRRFREGRR